MNSKKITTTQLVSIGLMAALVFVSSQMQILIPIGDTTTRLHLGNVFCILSGLLLGPVFGGFSAGIGSFFFDLTNPLYIASAPFTFAFKFAMAFIAGFICYSNKKISHPKTVIAAVVGALSYVFLYLSKTFIENALLGMAVGANWLIVIQKGGISSINAIIAVIAAVPIFYSLKAALNAAGLLVKINPRFAKITEQPVNTEN